MAFKGLKRFFSIGSKKNKNTKKRLQIVHSVPTTLQPISEAGHLADDSGEIVASQLLRSSSARYAVVNEVDYNSLPPLPHPINRVLQTPASSSISLASSAATSISSTSRGTYTVKVHHRKHHTHTEFPNANRDLDDEPTQRNNNSQLLGLRSDPSVASLLDLYDEHGRLPARAFSNSPPKEGRAQVQRNGSTLRQLLGNPSSSVNSRDDGAALEGDISWAERFLGETESIASRSSTFSLGLHTPDTDSHFPETPHQNTSLTEHDFSSCMSENHAISSLEVELSDLSESPPRPTHNSPYIMQDPKTPQRASQVFGFLTDKRRSRVVDDDERSLPELPSAFSSPSDEDSPPARGRSRSHFSSDSSADSIEPAAPPIPITPIETQFRHVEVHADTTVRAANEVQVIMAHGPTKVILTAPTPSHHDNIAPTRVPRGPRSHQRPRSSRHVPRDSFTAIPSRRHVSRSSSLSMGSISVSLAERAEPPPTAKADKGKRRSILAVFEKENHLSAKQELPRTPIRTGSISRPFNRGATHRAPASPASSLELSAAGQQLMIDLRQQRMKAREQDRRGRGYF
ncbi:hypothetical protein B0H19DRAFT_1251692 [Mycena capillaripes]|nr:hypothetical protein B0H19DRAFT_1251692 [Mycena capillaripes]